MHRLRAPPGARLLVTYGYNHGHPITEVPALAHVDRLDQVNWARLFAA